MTGECVANWALGIHFAHFFTPDMHGELLPGSSKVQHCADQVETQRPSAVHTQGISVCFLERKGGGEENETVTPVKTHG